MWALIGWWFYIWKIEKLKYWREKKKILDAGYDLQANQHSQSGPIPLK